MVPVFFVFRCMAGKKKKGGRTPRSGSHQLPPSQRQRIVDQVWALAGPVCDSAALEVIHVEFRPEQAGRILRLYIDGPDGVTLDDCAWVSRQLSDLFDVALECDLPYQLEVSSPGSERPLSRKCDFEAFTGRMARIKTTEPIDGRRNHKGVLAGVSEEMLQLTLDGCSVDIPLRTVVKANLVSDYGEKGC
jgi:ribosome maturation factor RimP